jgi:ribosomal protein L11 methyltransferase
MYRYIWRKQASATWLRNHEAQLLAGFGENLALIDWPARKWTTVEICCTKRHDAVVLERKFGGKFGPIPAKFPPPSSKPLKIGARLVISNVGGASVPRREKAHDARSRRKGPSHISHRPRRLVIPAAGAFGTGEHVTTAMCLRMLEKISRKWPADWTFLDAGTGSGILALAAHVFGARSVIAIDTDPRAIEIAKSNASLNRIEKVQFKIADATKYRLSRQLDVIAANLFSELLVTAIPIWKQRLRTPGSIILSGILRGQERDVVRALRKSGLLVQETRQRGKWVAVLAGR